MQIATEDIEIQKVGNVRFLYYPHKSYLTNIQILTQVGSASEGNDNHGMAHILEHMFFKGSQKRSGGTAISRAANDIGAKMNAYTTYDHTVYYISVLNEYFSEGFDILADMYTNPLFPEEEFAKELNPILSELREREDDPDSYLMERAFANYFGASYHPIIGTEKSIRSANVEKMHNFRQDFYGGENCLVAIAGGVSKQEALSCVDFFFGKMPMKRKPVNEKVIPQNTKELLLTKAGISEAYCHFFFPALEATHPDCVKQDIMNYLLGGNDSALLFERIREELGMSCYGIYSWIMRDHPFHTLGISCGIAPNELEQLSTEVMAQINLICKSHLNVDALKRCQASIRASVAARAETSAGLNSMMALPVLRGETENPVQKFLHQIESTTLDDVLEMAQKTLSGPMLKAVLTPA